ncbi:transcriptional regulator [Streptomyces mangrovisoli]|uniref:Transcriptional regulator n=1 Tax=Streptomyces mangrovisoli TaxID=1428628 RepID=A0A1J4P351_9ACTN|nr:transcriptional regulator [Streptomyces mangrovisoli]
MDPAGLTGRPCALTASLQLIGDRWALLAIREVMLGNHRFRQIARNTGAPTDRLSARLKDLVAAGVLERRPLPDESRHEGYHLTEAGRDLTGVVRELLRWGDRWAVTSQPMRIMHHEHEFEPRTACAACGETVDQSELRTEVIAPGWDAAGPVA